MKSNGIGNETEFYVKDVMDYAKEEIENNLDHKMLLNQKHTLDLTFFITKLGNTPFIDDEKRLSIIRDIFFTTLKIAELNNFSLSNRKLSEL